MGMGGWQREAVVDVDDFLVNISIPWVRKALGDTVLCTDALRRLAASPEALTSAVLSRDHGYVQPWLMEKYGVRRDQAQRLDALYRDDGRFYDDLPLSRLGDGIVRMVAGGIFTRLTVVTHVFDMGDAVNKSKERWLERCVRTLVPRAEIVLLPASEKKSDVIKRNAPEAYFFGDDSLKNVFDVIENTNVREVIVPKMGHNHINGALAVLAKLKGVALRHALNPW